MEQRQDKRPQLSDLRLAAVQALSVGPEALAPVDQRDFGSQPRQEERLLHELRLREVGEELVQLEDAIYWKADSAPHELAIQIRQAAFVQQGEVVIAFFFHRAENAVGGFGFFNHGGEGLGVADGEVG